MLIFCRIEEVVLQLELEFYSLLVFFLFLFLFILLLRHPDTSGPMIFLIYVCETMYSSSSGVH